MLHGLLIKNLLYCFLWVVPFVQAILMNYNVYWCFGEGGFLSQKNRRLLRKWPNNLELKEDIGIPRVSNWIVIHMGTLNVLMQIDGHYRTKRSICGNLGSNNNPTVKQFQRKVFWICNKANGVSNFFHKSLAQTAQTRGSNVKDIYI